MQVWKTGDSTHHCGVVPGAASVRVNLGLAGKRRPAQGVVLLNWLYTVHVTDEQCGVAWAHKADRCIVVGSATVRVKGQRLHGNSDLR